jgi:hypothetical protein
VYPFTEYLVASPAYVLVLWASVVLVVTWVFLRHPRTLVLAKGERGRLEISRHALHRLLETCCEQLPGVASARAEVTRRRGAFRTTLRLKVRPDAKLDAIQGYLTQEIADIYRQNLGLENVGPVEIAVVGVVAQEKRFA